MKSETLIKKVEAFKAELEKYYKATDGSEIPDIETTVIGSGGVIDYRITKTHVIRTEKDSFSTFEDKYKIGYHWDEVDLAEQIRYDKRRLKKGWRVWRSENPDLELEKDDEN